MVQPFNAQIIEANIERHVENRMKLLTRNLVYNLRAVNPEDTGFSETNWLASIGGKITNTLGIYDRNKTPGQQDFAGQQRSIAVVRLRYRLSMGSVFVGNVTHYIQPIDRKYNFVQDAVNSTIAS